MNETKSPTLTFNYSVDEVNLILSHLAKGPFEKVFALIGRMENEANAQLNPKPSVDSTEVK